MITLSDAKILSAAIRAGRGALNWSQQELAEKAGTALPTVARIETGVTSPKVHTLSLLISALEKGGVSFDWTQPNGFGLKVAFAKKPVGKL